jgi:hypothetical protein
MPRKPLAACAHELSCGYRLLAAKVRFAGSSAAITGAFPEPEAEQQLETLFGAGTTELQLSLKRREIEAFVHQVSPSGLWREALYTGLSTNGSQQGCKAAWACCPMSIHNGFVSMD